MSSYLLSELLPESRIIHLEAADKTRALQELLDVMARTSAVNERVAVERAILSREVLMSTGMGYGIAVPHAKLPSVGDFAMALGLSDKGVAYSSVVDDMPVRLVCMIVGPSGRQEDYLRILRMVMRFLKSEKGKVLSAYSIGEIHGFTKSYDTTEGRSSADAV